MCGSILEVWCGWLIEYILLAPMTQTLPPTLTYDPLHTSLLPTHTHTHITHTHTLSAVFTHAAMCLGVLKELLRTDVTAPKAEIRADVCAGEEKPAPNDSEHSVVWCVDAFRGITVLLTCYAILAVDFELFPRRHAKTEETGLSLMDLGSGSALFSAGLVAGKCPARAGAHTYTTVLTLGALGATRLLAVESTGYTTHTSEYGRHWNFFWTLAAVVIAYRCTVRVAAGVGITLTPMALAAATVCVGAVHQGVLDVYFAHGVDTWPRDGVLGANKEGLASILGYLTLFCGGAAVGAVIFGTPPVPPTHRGWHYWPSSFASTSALRLLLPTALIWSAFVVSVVLGPLPSRKLANVPYCLAVLATNTLLLLLISVLDGLLPCTPTSRRHDVLRRVSRQQLTVFITANILTGCTNLSVNTLAISASVADFVILRPYMILCAATPVLADAVIKTTGR
jgi:phosphatidylinositol glycan class W